MRKQTQQVGILNNPFDFRVGLQRTLDGGEERGSWCHCPGMRNDDGRRGNWWQEREDSADLSDIQKVEVMDMLSGGEEGGSQDECQVSNWIPGLRSMHATHWERELTLLAGRGTWPSQDWFPEPQQLRLQHTGKAMSGHQEELGKKGLAACHHLYPKHWSFLNVCVYLITLENFSLSWCQFRTCGSDQL